MSIDLEDSFVSIIPKCLGPKTASVRLTSWKGVNIVYGGRTADHAWPELAADFERFARDVVPKDQQVYFVQGVAPSGYRSNADMAEMTIIALDADDVGPWDALRATLDALGLAYILYQSSGHGGPRKGDLPGFAVKWRCLIPLARPYAVAGEDGPHRWRHAYDHVAALFGHAAGITAPFDLSLNRPQQPVYVNCRRVEEATPREVVWAEGRTFDLDAFASRIPAPPAFKPRGVATDARPAIAYLCQAAGLLGEERGGMTYTKCLWDDEHSHPLGDAEPTSATVILPPTEGNTLGVYKCLHASCAGRWSRDHLVEKLGPEIVAEADRLEREATRFPGHVERTAVLESPPGVPTHAPRVEAVLRSEAFARPQATYPTSYLEFNELIGGGLKARQLAVIAGPTGNGKTGFASSS
jgi:hypothetical protein